MIKKSRTLSIYFTRAKNFSVAFEIMPIPSADDVWTDERKKIIEQITDEINTYSEYIALREGYELTMYTDNEIVFKIAEEELRKKKYDVCTSWVYPHWKDGIDEPELEFKNFFMGDSDVAEHLIESISDTMVNGLMKYYKLSFSMNWSTRRDSE